MDHDAFRNIAQNLDETLSLSLKGTRFDSITVVGKGLYVTGPKAGIDEVLDAIRCWQILSKYLEINDASKHSRSPLGERSSSTTLGRLLLGGWIRDSNQNPVHFLTEADVSYVLDFVKSGKENYTCNTIYGMIQNQKFFITESGLMGLSHLDTEPGDEVWVLNGGKVPFVLVPRGGDGNSDYDFVGRSHVEGIMLGEIFEDKGKIQPEQTIRLH